MFGVIGVDSVPVLRSRSSGNNEWLIPADLIDDDTAGIVWREQSELMGTTDALQTITMSNLL
jgi:hypothetical protein